MTPKKVAIIVNGGFLNAVGLKALLLEEMPTLNVRFLASDKIPELKDETLTFSFQPIPDTVVVSASDGETPIRQQVHKALMSLKQESATKTNEKKMLSQRETEVLRLVASGLINKEIAEKLHISLQTVLTHRKHISEKLEIRTTAGFTAYALLNGLV